MTFAMFIFLLLWVAVFSPKPETKSFMSGVQVRKTDRTYQEILRDYGKQ